MTEVNWVFNDGGRKAEGFPGDKGAGDCVVRAIAIACELSYTKAYDLIREEQGCCPYNGVENDVLRKVLADLGWVWTPKMQIGQGCRVHLRPDELPGGRLVVRVTRHVVAVVDGVIHDTYDPSRGGKRCVYGYFQPKVG